MVLQTCVVRWRADLGSHYAVVWFYGSEAVPPWHGGAILAAVRLYHNDAVVEFYGSKIASRRRCGAA